MNKKTVKISGLFLGLVLLFIFSSSNLTYGSETITVEFSPPSVSNTVNSPIPFTMQFFTSNPSSGISGFDMCLKYDPAIIAINELSEPIDANTFSSGKFQSLKKEIDNNQGQACFMYVSILPDEELARGVKIDGLITGKSQGLSNISFSKSEIVGSTEGHSYLVSPATLSLQISSPGIQTVQVDAEPQKEPGFFQKILNLLKKILPFI